MQQELNITHLSLPLGSSISERLTETRRIIRALTNALIVMCENDMAHRSNPDTEVITGMLLEAQTAESYLSQL